MIQDMRAEGFNPRRVLLHPMDHRQAYEDYVAKTSDKSADAEKISRKSVILCWGNVDVVEDARVPRGSAWVEKADGSVNRVN